MKFIDNIIFDSQLDAIHEYLKSMREIDISPVGR
jgi:hypothetical protein